MKLVAALTALLVTLALAPQAGAAARATSKILGYVTAHSHDGNGSIRAPYRATSVGYQVRLPHGTWVYCRTSCSETLRVNTVDVWANVDDASPIGVGTLSQECGVFGCLRWERSF
jgi:hypothetical protein